MRQIVRLLALLGLSVALGACTLVKLREESKTFYASTVLVGRVSAPPGWKGPIVVAAYTKSFGRITVAHCTLLHEAGGFELMVPNGGEYQLFAFGDANGNLHFDAGEPAGAYLSPQPIAASGTGIVANLDFVLKKPADDLSIPLGTEFSACGAKSSHSTQAGAIANLDDPLFSAEYGSKGYWAPMEFFKEAGGNIYFLEPYDPRKIPILFVHGAGGSPQDWRYFFDHIDRSRYQPWFFYYASGSTIESMAHLLFWKLFNLQLAYRFEKVYIVAHSMGGLVVRSLLLNHGAQMPAVKLFVSLSTPWGGEPTAEFGVKNSPAVVPSWNDIQPQGQYMRSLFARKLPAEVDYYLLFGYKGGYSMMRPNNDGTVTLASELRKPAQAEAKMVYGFDEDHVGILSSPQVLAQYQAILDATGNEHDAAAALQSGSVQVNFSIVGPGDGLRLQPRLLLRPVDGKRAPISIPLISEDAGREVGPIPTGDYDANLVAESFQTEPRKVRVSVAPGQTPTLNFQLTARGTLSGYVGTGQADIPAGSYVPPDESVKIDTITLSGVGVERKLVPRAHDDGREVDRYLVGEDDAVKAYFSFVDLPSGEYLLTIRSNGYLPYIERYTVIPGRPGLWKPIILRVEK